MVLQTEGPAQTEVWRYEAVARRRAGREPGESRGPIMGFLCARQRGLGSIQRT